MLQLVGSYRLLRFVDVSIQRLSYTMLKAFQSSSFSSSSIDYQTPSASSSGRDSVSNSTLDEINKHDTIMTLLCQGFSSRLKDKAWWLDHCQIHAPSLKKERIRSFLLRRIARNGVR